MLPELIRMACTAYGAWGKATATGKGLIQVRAFDGPWVNFTVAATFCSLPQVPRLFLLRFLILLGRLLVCPVRLNRC